MNKTKLRIALQRSGRLHAQSCDFLQSCGIAFMQQPAMLCWPSTNCDLELILVRDDDIPNLVQQGICDFGIVGLNVLQEANLARPASGLKLVKSLNFAACRLAIAIPNQQSYTGKDWLAGKTIATSYPHILLDYLDKNQIEATVMLLKGSVEIAPQLGMADAICDLVSTGNTLKANGLQEVEIIFESVACLIQHANSSVNSKQLFNLQERVSC